jgi:hypothetical protein
MGLESNNKMKSIHLKNLTIFRESIKKIQKLVGAGGSCDFVELNHEYDFNLKKLKTFIHWIKFIKLQRMKKFPARQVPEIIFNISSKNTGNALKSTVYVISLVLNLVFKTVFEIFLAHLVCLKYVK